MNYFFDCKEKKLKAEIDQNKLFLVSWADKGCITKFKILSLKFLDKFYFSLNPNYSKVIHHFPPTNQPWVTYNGLEGDNADNLNTSVYNINWDQEYYAVIVCRSACGFRMNILPKSPAITEYQLFKPSIGLTKLLVRISDGEIINQYGKRIGEGKKYYNDMIQTEQFDI